MIKGYKLKDTLFHDDETEVCEEVVKMLNHQLRYHDKIAFSDYKPMKIMFDAIYDHPNLNVIATWNCGDSHTWIGTIGDWRTLGSLEQRRPYTVDELNIEVIKE